MEQTTISQVFGKHMLLYLSSIDNHDVLSDGEQINYILKDVVLNVGMRILSGPLVSYEDGDRHKQGYSGVVILYESHAAIHTYVHLKRVFFDLFSCKNFETDKVQETLKKYFGNYVLDEMTVLLRGNHWNIDVDSELNNWIQKR